MQSSQTTDDLCQDDNKYNQHKPVKHVRSHDIHAEKQPEQNLPFRKNRSMSSGFRHSIRKLTSCALVRRKHGRTMDHNDHGTSANESSVAFEDDHQSSKALLISKKASSISPSHKKSNRHIVPSIQSTGDNSPPSVPSDENNKMQIPSKFNSSTRIQSTTNDDLSLPNARKSSNKEISTSLGNLMGTASDSVPINNTTQIPTHQARPRKNSVISLLQHISSTPAATVDRLGLLDSSSNVNKSGIIESPSFQRTIFTGCNHSGNSSPNSSTTKLSNEYTWCYENPASIQTNSGASFDECLPRLEIDEKPLIYRQQFEPTEHFNWYGISDAYGPVIISYKYSNDQDKQRFVTAIVRTRLQTSTESLLDVSASCTSIDILRRLCEQCSINDVEYFDPILCNGAHDLLLKYDESHVSTKHKFGIIYQCEDQLTEEDIFSNQTHSIAMEKFLDLIGDRVKLKDFQGFRGGLDVKYDYTGTESVYEQFNNHEIMFHVSTLLPYSKIERQQLERKRHIGNDIIAIVFQEYETIFNPECIASQFLHVYLVVTPLDNDGTRFKVSVIHRDSVPPFGPFINHSNSFNCDHTFKQWILTKLINAEMASYRASTFQKYHERTKITLFENLYRTLHDNNRSFMSFILNHSQYKHECDIEQQKDSTKTYDRPTDNSLLGSVRRRFIAPKVRTQHPSAVPPATVIISTPTSNDSKSKTSSIVMDLKRSTSKESVITNGNNNGKVISVYSSSKNYSPRMEKSNTDRSLADPEYTDPSTSTRSNSKFLSPKSYPSSPFSDTNSNEDLSAIPTDDTNQDTQLSHDDLQSSSKDDLIKLVISLQQQHLTKLARMDQIHSKVLKQLQMQMTQQQNTINGDGL